MRKASVRDLHIHTSAIVREAAEGGVILIERRGEAVAELRPISDKTSISTAAKDEIFFSMIDIWDNMPMTNDVTRMIEEDRDR